MQIGRFPDGVQGEVFLDAAKQNSALDALAADAAILISLLLQHGATPAEIGHTLRRAPDGTAASLIGAVVDRLVEEGATAAANHPLADSGSSPILGVDPGIAGGLAFLFPTGALEVGDIPVVAGEVDVDTLVRQVRAFSPALAVIERANAMPKQGVSSTFKYGVAYGALRTVVALCNIPYHLVTPAKWKSHFRLGADKEQSRALVSGAAPRVLDRQLNLAALPLQRPSRLLSDAAQTTYRPTVGTRLSRMAVASSPDGATRPWRSAGRSSTCSACMSRRRSRPIAG
jgi:crossover junction endodeoxyribonuclease RuvC